ncbi:MAG TPA: chromate transporter [Stellaceae bacterium]|nr:chromate transporter [Stellaceae bacterium]
MTLGRLALLVLSFNLLTFGNGPTMIPLLQRHLVIDTGVLSLDQFLYAFAVGRVTPGQANLYVAAIGYMTYGLLGAAAMMAAIQLPGYLMLPLAKSYERYRRIRAVQGLTRGLTASSVGVVLYAAFAIGRETLTSGVAWLVFALTLGFILGWRWNPLAAILAAGSIGGIVKLGTG